MAFFEDLKELDYGFRKLIKWLSRKLLAGMLSLIQCFAVIAGCIKEKTKMDITRPPPPHLTDIIVKYVFELRRTCLLLVVEKCFTSILSLKI